MENRTDRLAAKIKRGETVLGTHSSFGGGMVTEIYGAAGFDAVWIDTEHGVHDPSEVLNSLIGARTSDMCAFVRIPWNEAWLAKPILDCGADGIIFPMINTAEDAVKAVAACRYPPAGVRGFGPFRAVRYGGVEVSDYINRQSGKVWTLLQIEHIDGVNNLDAILKVPGIDAIVVGPCDLSGSLGHLGEINHPEVKQAMDVVAGKTRAAGIPVAVSMVWNDELLRDWIRREANLIFADTDGTYISSGCRRTLSRLRELTAGDGAGR